MPYQLTGNIKREALSRHSDISLAVIVGLFRSTMVSTDMHANFYCSGPRRSEDTSINVFVAWCVQKLFFNNFSGVKCVHSAVKASHFLRDNR